VQALQAPTAPFLFEGWQTHSALVQVILSALFTKLALCCASGVLAAIVIPITVRVALIMFASFLLAAVAVEVLFAALVFVTFHTSVFAIVFERHFFAILVLGCACAPRGLACFLAAACPGSSCILFLVSVPLPIICGWHSIYLTALFESYLSIHRHFIPGAGANETGLAIVLAAFRGVA